MLLDPAHRVRAAHRQPTGFGTGQVLDSAADAVSQLLQQTPEASGRIASIGVGIPGTIDHGNAVVRHAVNLGIVEMPLRSLLAGRTGLPVVVDNDVNASSVGLHDQLGLDAGQSLVFLNLGTGVAAGLILRGRLWAGATGAAGEIGHIPLAGERLRCACGQTGCLELFASGGGHRRQRAERGVLSPHREAEAEAELDRKTVLAVATAVRTLVLTLDPAVIALGGGVVVHRPALLQQTAGLLEQWAEHSPLLASLAIPGRLRPVPESVPVAAIGAALLPTTSSLPEGRL